MKTTGVERERRWLLWHQWGRHGGWNSNMFAGTKKWDAAQDWLVKKGYLEADDVGGHTLRMTSAGREWLEAEQ